MKIIGPPQSGQVHRGTGGIRRGSVSTPTCKSREPWALISCYTDSVHKNITIKISEQLARWARRKAAEENTSVSRLVGDMLERQMRLTDEYWRAFEHWKSVQPKAEVGAAERLSREDTHERR